MTPSHNLIFILTVAIATQVRCHNRCLKNTGDVSSPHYLFFQQEKLNITIQTSSRKSHQLVNDILRILLQDKIGYHVDYVHTDSSLDASTVLADISGCSNNMNSAKMQRCPGFNNKTNIKGRKLLTRVRPPKAMVNIEMWSHAGYNIEKWIKAGLVEDCGPLGPFGKFGWFIPTFFETEVLKEDKTYANHHRALQNINITRRLHIDTISSVRQRIKSSFCKGVYCKDGIYSPPQCVNIKCALLLNDFAANGGEELKKMIINTNLSVEIAWLGKDLEPFIKEMTAQGKPTLFFSYQPSIITSTRNFSRIFLPTCWKSLSNHPTECDYTVNQLSKMVWSHMKTHASQAYSLISKLHISHEMYTDILKNYSILKLTKKNYNIQKHACQWVRTHENIWKKWLPSTTNTVIKLGGLFPIAGKVQSVGLVPAAILAEKHINSDNSILKGYDLQIIVRNSGCDKNIVMREFINYVTTKEYNIAGILGPRCAYTAEPIAALTTTYNTMIVSYGQEEVPFEDKEKYPLFYRTSSVTKEYGKIYTLFLKKMDWLRVALIIDYDTETTYQDTFSEWFSKEGIEYEFFKVDREWQNVKPKKYLDRIRAKNFKIIISLVFDKLSRIFLCEAYRQHMTSKQNYVWFFPNWLDIKWWDTDGWNNQEYGDDPENDEHVNCTTKEMAEAGTGFFKVVHANQTDDNKTVIGDITVKQWKDQYDEQLKYYSNLARKRKLAFEDHDYRKRVHYYYISASQFASYTYDAVWAWAKALDGLLREYEAATENYRTDQVKKKLKSEFDKISFQGVSGKIFFSGGERKVDIVVLQYCELRAEHGIHTNPEETKQIARYSPEKNGSSFKVEPHKACWPGEKPTDGRSGYKSCSLQAFADAIGQSCETAMIIVNLLGVGSFIILTGVLLVVVKRRYDSKFLKTKERMEELGLMAADFHWLSLDEWEMPRDHVVLNRKLGEGAFGMVYGGEAKVNDAWAPVAVKTLKIGSSPEEKLDFLSEAEMMKRFNHDNIVELHGVCTRGEPAYAVMEFMLYGDLKTFLLARRHLVNSNSPEEKDVTAPQLTKMALDVAKGLDYLISNRYVHRDLACRNCLVHASKMVKIGDFGMTRPIYNHDYYRFNKRGMLPVRWMSPESLTDGIFTSKSDIWSFGILLYEIITFGSFPYQGLSNNQVLEYVKNGNTISLPAACSPQLKKVFTKCWIYKAEKRANMDEVITELTSDPALIQPMLDTPTAAVIEEDSDSLAFEPPLWKDRDRGVLMRRRNNFLRSNSSTSYTQELRNLSSTDTANRMEMDDASLASSNLHQSDCFSRNSCDDNINALQSDHNHVENDRVITSSSCDTSNCIGNSVRPTTNDLLMTRMRPNSTGSSSPTGLLHIRLPRSFEDSDYCSGNSKESWNHHETVECVSHV